MHIGGYFDSSSSSYSASGSTSTSTYASPSSTPATSTSSYPPTTMAITTTMVLGGGVGGSSNGGSSTNGSTHTHTQRARPRGLWKARATPAPRPGPENKFPGHRGVGSGGGVGGEFSCCQHRGEGTYGGNAHRRDAELRGGDPRGEFPYPHHSLLPSSHHHHLSHQPSSASHHHHHHHHQHSSSSYSHQHQHQHPSTHTHLYPIAYDDDCLSCSGDYDDWSDDCCASSTGSLDLEHSLLDSLLPDHLLPDHEHYIERRRAYKKRRLQGTENSNTPPTSDEEVLYWDYSRRCSPHPERLSKWITRSKVMDTSSVTNTGGEGKGKDGAGRRGGEKKDGMKDASVGPAPGGETAQTQTQTTCDLEDWEDLKELFAKAAEMYENQPPSEAIPLLRGVIHECHRFLRLYYDPSIIYATPPPDTTNKTKETPPEQRVIRDWLADKGVLYPPGGVVGGGQGRKKEEKEKKCKCKDLPTSFYTILGTTLFFFGNLLDQDPALAYPGEPSSPVPYWLSALDVFEIGENLPIKTSGRGCPSAPEDWRMAIVWGRTLVCLAHEVLARENEKEKIRREREKNGESAVTPPPSSYPTSPAATTTAAPDPFAHLSFPFSLPPHGVPLGAALGGISGLLPSQHSPTPQQGTPDEPVWPPNSPFALIVERRLPRTRRMTLGNTTAEEMMVVAKDQFSRGIFHMPHPLHYLGGRARRVGSNNNNYNSNSNNKGGYSAGIGFGSTTTTTNGDGGGGGGKESTAAVFTITPPLTAYYSSTLAYESSTPFDSCTVASATLDDPQPQTQPQPQTPTQKSDSPQPTTGAAALLQGESFSRAKELFTIASEVLDVAERFPSPSSRAGLAAFADGILSQMKLEANTERTGGAVGSSSNNGVGGYGGDGGRGNVGDGAMGYGAWAGAGAIVLARGRANLVIGTARAEEIEERLEALEDDSEEEGGKRDSNNTKSAGEGGDAKHDDDGDEKKREKAERKRKADEVWECDEAVDGREALGVAVVYLEKAREALGAWVQEEDRAKAGASPGVGASGNVGAGAEDEEIMVVESEDGDGDDEEEYEMDEDSDVDDADAEDATAKAKNTSRRAAAVGAKSTTTTTGTTSSSFVHTPPSPTETIEEIGMMLAEALVTLANLTRDKREREVLYARAQKESGDAIVLDEEEDGMDI